MTFPERLDAATNDDDFIDVFQALFGVLEKAIDEEQEQQ